jgi:hypothetical protein
LRGTGSKTTKRGAEQGVSRVPFAAAAGGQERKRSPKKSAATGRGDLLLFRRGVHGPRGGHSRLCALLRPLRGAPRTRGPDSSPSPLLSCFQPGKMRRKMEHDQRRLETLDVAFSGSRIAGQRVKDSCGLIDGAELDLGLVVPDNVLAHAYRPVLWGRMGCGPCVRSLRARVRTRPELAYEECPRHGRGRRARRQSHGLLPP